MQDDHHYYEPEEQAIPMPSPQPSENPQQTIQEVLQISDDFGELLESTDTQLVVETYLEHAIKQGQHPRESPFDLRVDPNTTIQLQSYIDRVFRYCQLSPAVFVVALFYLYRLETLEILSVTHANVHKLFITALLVSAKTLEDYVRSNNFFRKVAGISLSTMNELEVEFLNLMEWDTNVHQKEFVEMTRTLDKLFDPSSEELIFDAGAEADLPSSHVKSAWAEDGEAASGDYFDDAEDLGATDMDYDSGKDSYLSDSHLTSTALADFSWGKQDTNSYDSNPDRAMALMRGKIPQIVTSLVAPMETFNSENSRSKARNMARQCTQRFLAVPPGSRQLYVPARMASQQ